MKCHEKKRYLTRTDAKRFLKEQERKYPDMHKQKTYHCSCGYWHVYTKVSCYELRDKFWANIRLTEARCGKLIDDIFNHLNKKKC